MVPANVPKLKRKLEGEIQSSIFIRICHIAKQTCLKPEDKSGMHCECGYLLQGSERFCPDCGKRASAPPPAPLASQTIPCPNTVQEGRRIQPCGNLIESTKRFCTECGWRVDPKAFMPGAAMCNGKMHNGEPCDNIVTPNNRFCSECGEPPGKDSFSAAAPAAVERTIPMDSHDSISGSQNPPHVVEQEEQTSEEMDFEVVSLSEGEGRQIKRSSNNEEAVIHENSSDFCNCLHAKSNDSSMQDSNCQPQDKSLNDIHDTDTPSKDSTITAEKEMKESLEKENKSTLNAEDEEINIAVQQQSIEMGSPLENAATREITRNDQPQEIDKKDRNDVPFTATTDPPLNTDRNVSSDELVDARDGVNNNQSVSPITNKPQNSSYQNEGAKDEINDSVTISRENSVYHPTWKDDVQATIGLIERMETLEMRKRKSPDKEILGDPKKRHVSESRSDDNVSKDEQGPSESGAEDEKDMSTDDEEDEEDEEENANADQSATKKKKKRPTKKKKKKLEYQKKKGQLVSRPTDNVTNESQKVSFKKSESRQPAQVQNKVENMKPEVQSKSENLKPGAEMSESTKRKENMQGKTDEEKLKQRSNTSSGESGKEARNGMNNSETSPSTTFAAKDNPQNPRTQEPGKISIPVTFLGGKENSKENKNDTSTSMDDKKQSTSYAAVAASNRPVTRSFAGAIEVHFHVLVSKNLVKDPNEDYIVISFYDTFWGLWQDLCHRMHPKDLNAGDYIYYEGSVHVPKAIAHQTIYYNYFLYPNGLKDWGSCEFFYDQKERSASVYRSLIIPSSTEMTNRYDGIVVGVPDENKYYKYIWNSFKTDKYEEDMDAGMLFALKYFFPKWKGYSSVKDFSNLSCKEALDCIDSLHKGFWSNYGERFKKWRQDYMKFKKHIGMIFWDLLQPKIEEFAKGRESDIVSAMSILYIIDRFSLDVKESAYSPLFQALVQVSWDYKRVINNFDEKMMIQTIERLVNTYKEINNPVWLCCLPLYHLVTKKIQKPYDKLQLSKNHSAEVPKWWGINGIDGAFNVVKRKFWNPKDLLDRLSPLFEMDYLLPRSFMAALKYEQLKEVVPSELIPVEVTLATLYYFVKSHKVIDHKDEVVKVCFDTLAKQLKSQYNEENMDVTEDVLNHAWISYNIAGDLVELVLKNYQYRNGLCVRTFSLFVMTIAVFDFLIHKRGSGKDLSTQHKIEDAHLTVLHKFRDTYVQWLKEQPHSDTKKYFEAWSYIFKMQLQLKEGVVKTSVFSEVKRALKKDLTSRRVNANELFNTYCSDDVYPPEVQEVLTEIALKVIEEGCSLNDTILSSKGVDKYGVILCKNFETVWKKRNSEGNQTLLQFTLSWPSFFHFLNMFYRQEKRSKVLSKDTDCLLKSAAQQVWTAYQDLETGEITVKNINLIQENKENFCKIMKVMAERDKKEFDFQERIVTDLINIRNKEISHFEKILSNVRIFTDMCLHIEVDTLQFDEALTTFRELKGHKISTFCNPASLGRVADVAAYVPDICAFPVEEEILEIIPQLQRCSRGTLFMKLWERKGKKCVEEKQGIPLTSDEVISIVWEPVYEKIQAISKQIRDGTMLFTEFQKHFGKFNDDCLVEELQHLAVDGDREWIKKRMEQIIEHRTVQQCVKGALIIMDVVKTYELEGNFQQISLIVEMAEGKDVAMCKLDKDLIKATASLKGMTEAQAHCLQVFNECKSLVKWLRESMKSLQELKVFVDLASISAGEGAMEVDKVKCLHAATTGYAPLIFNLDQTCDSKMFLEKCELVWKELNSDPKLPKKLIDTRRQLEWLNSVKSAQGSVEVTSMRQAEAINSVGIYVVGKIDPGVQTEKPTLGDVLQLHVQEDTEGSRLRKKYKHKELQELQSKLMLVAGKAELGKDDVERFTIVYDAVVRLCNVYIKLVSAGCVLFTNWQAKFLCDPTCTRKVCAFIKFGSGDGCTQLKGRRDEEGEEDVSTIIPRLAKFMETCLEEWLQYIDRKRDDYHLLNFFTIDQMVILQKQLVLMGGETDPSDLIYPLLSIVKHDCTKMDLIGALRKAKVDVSDKEAELEMIIAENEEDKESDESDEEGTVKAKTIAKFISEIMNSGYTEQLARAALRKGIDPEEIDEGVVWCMEHEDQVEMEVEVSEEQVEVRVEDFEGWTQAGDSISTMTQSILTEVLYNREHPDEDTLIPDLEELWQKFLCSIESSVSDYLSVEHLGIILKRLAETETFAVKRPFLPGFEEGVPNLLLCPQDEILNTVLTIYSHDPEQPLPQSDEILMCTPHTTLDEVEIFWRRAVFDTTDRLYCLVSGDLLDYEVSDRAERRLDYHMQKAQERDILYKLVVVCSTEKENHSRIVAALDKYRRPPLPLLSHEKTAKYIKDKLTFNIKKPPVKPSAEADIDNCTVRVVKSWRAGVGKTLHKKRLTEKLHSLHTGVARTKKAVVSIPLHEREINIDDIMNVLLQNTLHPGKIEPRLFHIDLSHEVQEGVDYLLFQLLILGCLTNSTGQVWRKLPYDLYLVETMPLLARDFREQRGYFKCQHRCLDLLPDVTCRSPQESVQKYQGNAPDIGESDLLFDDQEFRSSMFQRSFQYLYRLDMNRGMADVNIGRIEGNPLTCLQTLLRHCGIPDPSWAELRHFVWFLNTQLVDFNKSDYLSHAAAEDLPGFSQFVLRFLIQMSRDFATRSLNMSEESPIQMLWRRDLVEVEEEETEEEELRQFQLRRTWESSPHPYLFFNMDRITMTFLGFNIDRQSGNLVDAQTGRVLEAGIMQRNLQDALKRNRVPINENFDGLPRQEKLSKLCSVMGVEVPYDPDPTYELTTDNVKKILAIYMRFRCDIPVIIMGETGCGKTRLVKFMCQLQCPIGVDVQNMVLMKVHGGTCRRDIKKKVLEAERIAKENTANFGHKLYTVLFFDEANTTEAIGLIKEIMCDRSMEGEPLELCQSLKIVAACNPYRKHSEDLIKRLEQAGLGYHVDAEKTTDRMGRVPMRRLVYRVQPLPQSMLPLVWDFGQLDTNVEEMYIKQMVRRYIQGGKLPNEPNLDTAVSHILTSAQEFMRSQKDECSFVSLRDVERVLEVMSWFYSQTQGETDLFDRMEDVETDSEEEDEEEELAEDMEMEDQIVPLHQTVNDVTKSLVLALGVCYHACLKNREEFRREIVQEFRPPCVLPKGPDQMADIITRCQNVFLEIENLGANIAKNQALKENVFMMLVCIELRIPLFLVGKPGSSKSLAKTIVADAMQGNAAHTEIYRNYKQVQMVSFQCSPLSVPEGIVGTFRQCAMYQKDKDLNRFVSVVVLDEVGLAEDSPRMPLKTLHPLLEDGCQGDETPEEHKKVAFIGISNWALDPAKMNRGILVQREVPDLEELLESAEGICSAPDKKPVKKMIMPLIKPLAESYLEVFRSVVTKREFFGLRDFYSLIKMVYSFAEKNRKKPSWLMLQHCIKRNFGGFEHSHEQDPVTVFSRNLKTVEKIKKPTRDDPDCTPAGLIEACLKGDGVDSDTRYLLLLTENYGALTVLQQKILTMKNAITIFGSSFPSDQEYTQVCRNINRIKVCMETGNTVVLLNLENLYESLYDALNQYYVYFGGERYVDLGLGTHRVKCRVHKKFRLIVVAEKDVVYSKFPIPLINRLEKHFLNISTMLSPVQLNLVHKLEEWAEKFIKSSTPLFRTPRNKAVEETLGDVFMGYHADTCASIILHVTQNYTDDDIKSIEQEVLKEAKEVLLWCATPDGVLRAKSKLDPKDFDFVENIYYEQQKHDNLLLYLDQKIKEAHDDGESKRLFSQVTTNSKLITTVDVSDLSQWLHIPSPQITLLTLQSFDTEQQFCRQVKQSFERDLAADSLLIVQCDSGNENASLVACAQYCVLDQQQQVADRRTGKTHIVFIIHLPRVAGGGFTGFQCGRWHSAHIDDLRPDSDKMPSILEMRNKSVGTLLEKATGPSRPRDTEEMEWEGDQESQEVEMEEEQQDVYPHDFGSMQEHTGQVHVERKVDIALFIKLTARPALAMVKDPQQDSARTTKRVKILMELLHQETKGKITFMQGVGRHLAALMKEKEETMGQSAESWLYAEATKRECLNRAGTFRKARNQCIIEKLSPILAGLIAQVDTNSNLDLLIQKEPNSWEYKLWLEIINNPSATRIEYSMVVSPKTQQELSEVMVRGTGCDGQTFQPLMPFSWLIYRFIDQMMRTTQEVEKHESGQEMIQRVSNIIESSELGRVLQKCLNEVKVMECVTAYLSDFVHMVYHVTSKEEHKLVCQNLLNAINMDFQERLPSIVTHFVAIHIVHNKTLPRLRNFASITRVWPECSAKIIEFQQSKSQFYLVTDEELTLDVLGLYLLLKTLEPSKDTFTDPKGRQLWQKLVHKYRPVVERILGQFVSEGHQTGEKEFGRRCTEGIQEARCMWTRVTVLKLFLQHVCSDDLMAVDRLMSLWVMLKDNVDFKNIESLEKVEKFLKMCMKTSMTKLFGRQEKCRACESEIDERPIQLPCKDVICMKCHNDLRILGSEECPVCHNEIPQSFDPHQDNTQDLKIRKVNAFKRRCNSFFMDLVSQLCFSDDLPPSRVVVEKLMSYITVTARRGIGGRTTSKEMSVFEEGIDPTPVLRSFLLQHLLRTSSGEVRACLDNYFDKVQDLMSLQENDEKMVELCLLVIQCLEDSFHQDVSKETDPAKARMKLATRMMQQNVGLVIADGLGMEKLFCLAEVRFGLTVVSEVLHRLLVEKSVRNSQIVKRLLEAAGLLCDECGSRQPKLFLVKHLCRCFGVETYQRICKSTDASIVRWLNVPELQKNEILECSDRFIVCGDEYTKLREQLTRAILGQNLDNFEEAIQAVRLPDYQKRTLVLLAVMREVTMGYLYPENKRRVPQAAVEQLHDFLAQHNLFSNQGQLPAALCRNALWRRDPQLTVQEGMDLGHQSTVCLLHHLFITLLEIPEEKTLIEPLNRLAQQPADMQRSYLPTMPQDDVAEIKEALLAARKGGDENPVFYRCPNGHPYVIGNCGRPYYRGHCKDCGAEIGGEGHKLLPTNQLHDGLDQTATGHVLGRAEGRPPAAGPERSLSPVECAIVRLFTHMAMYLGANVNLQAIQSIIKPDLEVDNVLPFLWAHIEKDLQTIQRAVGRSVDDVYILMHRICRDMMEKRRGGQLSANVCVLADKGVRRKWEEDFSKTYLSPVLKEMGNDLKSMNKKLASDQRLGSDPLLCLLFEIDVPSEHSSPCSLHNVAAVWRYRSQINMEHLLHTVQVQVDSHKVLLMFLKEEKQLRALRLVPSILKLQRLLIQRFQRKLDRGEAMAMSIDDMIRDHEREGQSEEMRGLVEDFILAWQCVKDQLLTSTLPTTEGLIRVPKEYCQKTLSVEQPVAMLLPTFRDQGLCSYGLLYYLLKKQNSFLQEYCKVKKAKYADLPKVELKDVTSAHLISYHPDRDILPMVMANCHYTFQVGKGTKIDYNLGDLERQLMDRFLFSKSVINMPVYEFELMTYRSETTNAVVFRELREKIKQEPLTLAVATQICEEIRAYPDLCDTLDKLEITISFLKSVKGDPSMPLEKFMTEVLKMKNPFPSQKARSSCLCKHAQSLWITLAMEKTRRQASYKQDAFEGVVPELREELTEGQRGWVYFSVRSCRWSDSSSCLTSCLSASC
uniref:E3 ubiquitin-protein ligase rnf213-alpha-like isoform X1 n=1 Tax=Crassostrea virginica TaxID=6565 RepID=A0A8B8AS56_CRAVI|nr:E3 ubiquitin-protein ligase rnf213-alpha-like isoform X1 [Crassostrea virginica]